MKYLYEKILPGPDRSFNTSDTIGNVIECNFHVHPEYELIYIASSYGTRFIGDNINTFDVGDLTLIGPMVAHHYYNSPQDSTSDTWGHAKVIQFREDFAGSTLFSIPEMSEVKTMLEASNFGIEFFAEDVQNALPLINRLFSAEGSSRVTLLLEILALLARSDYKKLSTLSGSGINIQPDNRMNTILRYIHSNLETGQSLSLEKVAGKACMNPQAFSRYFKKVTMKRFIDYVNEVKTGKACRLLINSDKTVAEICFDAGFSNLSNFNRQFFKVKKMSPKKFRDNFRKQMY